jgi:ferrous iron transport protein B
MSSILESPSRTEEPAAASAERGAKSLVVALAGNPNAGKTSLFNSLTGLKQKVANYPGVTVERKEGVWSLDSDSAPARLIDLPGLYSLDAASIDEEIARDVITGRMASMPAPDVIVAVVDSTNLERNLYLVTQLLETGRPVVVALTMFDLAERAKLEIDSEALGASLGVRVVPVTAKQRRGLEELARAVRETVGTGASGARWPLSRALNLARAARLCANSTRTRYRKTRRGARPSRSHVRVWPRQTRSGGRRP